MSNDKMRAEFEAWASIHFFLQEEGASIFAGEYISCDMQLAWEAWYASRAGLVVGMPERADDFLYGRSWNKALDCCSAAIEAAGIKIKE